MTHDRSSRLEMDRRRWLKLGATSFVAASLPRTLLGAQPTPQACSPPIPLNHEPSNGGPCPYPIPWLDKNGNHNQIPPKPNVELSHIYHFEESWRAATASTAWVRIIAVIASPGALPRPTKVIWPANTGRHANRIKPFSPTPD